MILATTKVKDLDHFLKVYGTAGADKRGSHGSKGSTVYRDPIEEDRVWAVFDWDEEGWTAFATDPETPGIMQEAGHLGRPSLGAVPRSLLRLRAGLTRPPRDEAVASPFSRAFGEAPARSPKVAAVSDQTVGIVGGGIVGLAVARELVRRRPGTRVVVFEKEDRVAAHQTGHNSGVVHAGIYYKPGSLKAQLSTRGRHLLRDYCAEHGLPYDECGKLVVAVDPSELGRFDALEKTARENGVTGLRRVEAAEIVEIEPHAAGLAALHSPATAITDYVADRSSASRTRLPRRVESVRLVDTGDRRSTGPSAGSRSPPARPGTCVDRLVVCAGLQADRVSGWIDGEDGPRIVPFRGEYMAVKRSEGRTWCAAWSTPFRIPATPSWACTSPAACRGALEVGPNAVLALGREALRAALRGGRWRDVREHRSRGRASGGWRGPHWRTGVREVRGSLSVRVYMREAQRYVPEIGAADVVRGGQRHPRPGGRPGRKPGRRLPHHRVRRSAVRPQRALTRRDVQPGDRRARRGALPVSRGRSVTLYCMTTSPEATAPHHPVVTHVLTKRAENVQLRVADEITKFAGSMQFVYLHVVAFAAWMLLAEGSPWPTLTLVVSLEAIFLSTFVMIGQNRQAMFQQLKADHDFVAQEQELHTNTDLTRMIAELTREIHASVVPGATATPR